VIAGYIRNVMIEIAEGHGWEVLTQGMETDHYHVLISVPPRFAPCKVVETLKSNSARGIFKRFPDVKNRLWGGEFWADGYCVSTVGNSLNTDQVKRYIANQDISIKI
jgi:putative transposase